MKKHIILSMVVLGGLSASCSDSFLEEEMVSVITQDYFNTEQGLEQLITGTYDVWRVSKQYGHGPWTTLIGVDNINPQSSNVATYSSSEWSSTSNAAATQPDGLCGEYSSNSLLGYYPRINDCNRAIATIVEGKALGTFASDQSYANRRLAEAYVNRAYAAYMMNTMFGDFYFPRSWTSAMPANFNFPRETSESIYRQLIGDLRFAYEHLPNVTELNLTSEFGRNTKQVAAHFLAKLYLQRAQGAEYGTSEYGRNADGTIDTSNPNSPFGLLYKGEVPTDLDSCIYFASQVINSGYHRLADSYDDWFKHPMDDYSNESNPEIIQACLYSKGLDNGRYGARIYAYFGTNYANPKYGIPDFCWEYPARTNSRIANINDFGLDLYTNKLADARYQKGFWLEYGTKLPGSTNSVPTPDKDYYAYNSPDNATFTWTEEEAAYFNEHILPTYTRASWGGRSAVAGEHKMGTGDLAYGFVENTKETALTLEECLAQPFVVRARWIRDGDRYYYRVPLVDGDHVTYNLNDWLCLDKSANFGVPMTRKYDEPNRNQYNQYYTYRDIAIFRLGETYLLRAEAYGRKGDMANAIADINTVRARAAFKVGETRNEVLARLQPGHEKLTVTEQQWPYTVERDMTQAMLVDESYWDGASAASNAEMYPPEANDNQKRFQNFMLNELARELSFEMIYWENLHHSGWQYYRVRYNNQMAADPSLSRPDVWGVADNVNGALGQTGVGKSGFYQPYHMFKAFRQTVIDGLTDENGNQLDGTAQRAYQNYGY